MADKRFKLAADQLQPLAVNQGSCYATDEITVGGKRVGYMYREEPDNPVDSGWRFFSGTEKQEYIDDAKNLAIYDVNTIANYDPDIIDLLDLSFPVAFARNESGHFDEVDPPYDDDA